MCAALLLAAVMVPLVGAVAFAAETDTAAESASPESVFKKAGPPQCSHPGVECAIGLLLGDERNRFKVYTASDPALNGKALILAESTDSKDDLKALGGKIVLVEFAAVADKQLMNADVIGLAKPSDVAPKGTDVAEAVTVPATSIDLSNWKVTLPIDKAGKPGSALEVTKLAGFSLPPYFDVKPDSITFSASTDGSHTSGSHYPRSELREMNGSGQERNWTIDQGGTLSATLRINEVPQLEQIGAGEIPAAIPQKVPGPGRIVIGQIHGPDDELCRLYYDNGVLYFNDDKSGEKQEQASFALKDEAGGMTQIPLGKSFSYKIAANAQGITVSAVVDGRTYSASEPISAFWPGQELYFKAGAYVQVGVAGGGALETGSGTGSVTFTSIVMKHPG
jgi:hypothetical protein